MIDRARRLCRRAQQLLFELRDTWVGKLLIPRDHWWRSGHWTVIYSGPVDTCEGCGHSRSTHIGEPFSRGWPRQDDSGWCTLPAGTCIFTPCGCSCFVEPY